MPANSNKRSSIGVVGCFVLDQINFPDGQGKTDLGGLIYSLIPLAFEIATMPRGQWQIHPRAMVGDDAWHLVVDRLLGLPRVALRGLHCYAGGNPRVELAYTDAQHRQEKLSGRLAPFGFDDLAEVCAMDAVLWNFISGEELDLALLEELAKCKKGWWHADLHSLMLSHQGGGIRRLQRPTNWQRWVAKFDSLQVNEDEFRTLSGGGDLPSGSRSFRHHAQRLLDLGPRVVCITKGGSGVDVVTGAADGESDCRIVSIDGHRGAQTVDPTGCGDTFGAVFLAQMAADSNHPDRAARRANLVAFHKARFSGSRGLFDNLVQNIAGRRII